MIRIAAVLLDRPAGRSRRAEGLSPAPRAGIVATSINVRHELAWTAQIETVQPVVAGGKGATDAATNRVRQAASEAAKAAKSAASHGMNLAR